MLGRRNSASARESEMVLTRAPGEGVLQVRYALLNESNCVSFIGGAEPKLIKTIEMPSDRSLVLDQLVTDSIFAVQHLVARLFGQRHQIVSRVVGNGDVCFERQHTDVDEALLRKLVHVTQLVGEVGVTADRPHEN